MTDLDVQRQECGNCDAWKPGSYRDGWCDELDRPVAACCWCWEWR
jgi:hypothetical protein